MRTGVSRDCSGESRAVQLWKPVSELCKDKGFKLETVNEPRSFNCFVLLCSHRDSPQLPASGHRAVVETGVAPSTPILIFPSAVLFSCCGGMILYSQQR